MKVVLSILVLAIVSGCSSSTLKVQKNCEQLINHPEFSVCEDY